MAYTAKDPCTARRFLYLRETKSWRCEERGEEEQDGIHSQRPTPPWHFLYLTETKSWRCEGKGNKNVHLLTHAPARGVGKKSVC